MNKEMNLEIKYFGRVHYANLNLNKINVVGGINSSGKSTASKLLYCFLKANSVKRIEYLKEKVIPSMNIIINIIDNPKSLSAADLPEDKFSIDDDFSEILKEYEKAKKIYFKNKKIFELDFILDDIINNTNKIIRIIKEDNDDFNADVIKLILENESLSKFNGIANFNASSLKCSIINGKDYYEQEMHYNYKKYYDYPRFEYFSDFNGYYSAYGTFEYLTDVFYIDSFSIFDMKFKDGKYMEHIQYLLNNLGDSYDNDLDENVKYILELINDMVKGQFSKTNFGFLFFPENYKEENDSPTFKLSSPHKIEFGKLSPDNISSGIKQISIVQSLLANNKLKPGTFLIIDEPEVNLHPEWQFKFAEILVLIAKELDVVVYLNSHSSMFIESIDAFCEFYDFEDSVNFYLTEESRTKGQYSFKRIKSNELHRLYDNLGNPYDLIDELRLRKHLGD